MVTTNNLDHRLNAQSFATRTSPAAGALRSGARLSVVSQTAETPQEILNSDTSDYALGRRHQSDALATGQQIMMGAMVAEAPQPHVTLQADILFVNKHPKNLSHERTKLVRQFSKITLNADLPGV